jgi:ELWxxDGT repeat protein
VQGTDVSLLKAPREQRHAHVFLVMMMRLHLSLGLLLTAASSSAADQPTDKEAKVVIRRLLEDHGVAQPGSIRWLVQSGGNWFFNFDDSTHGAELWMSDLQSRVALVKDIYPGAEGSYPSHLCEYTAADGSTYVYFQAEDEESGTELWRSDGTAEGTKKFVEIMPGSAGSVPQSLTACAGKLFFGARDPEFGFEMFATDGKRTRLLEDITGNGDSQISQVECRRDLLHFTVGGSEESEPLFYKSDGTAHGTRERIVKREL